MHLTTLVENTGNETFHGVHGLSFYIETEKHRLLFDVGPDDTLFLNAKTAGIDLSKVDTVVLSHGHGDHGGALKKFLSVNDTARVYAQKSAFERHEIRIGPFKKDGGLDPALKNHPRVTLLKGDAVEKRTAAYSMVVPNFGYLGYPLVLALFGQEALAQFMAFTLPFNFYIYGFAMPQWMPKTGKNGLGARLKRMLSAPMIALLLGVAFGLSGLKLPTAVTDVLSSASACVGPCAMLLAGLSVAKRPLRRTLSNGRAYGISAIRLLVLPALVTALLLGLRQLLPLDRALFLIPCIYAALPLGLNPVVFAETYGGDGSFGADCGLISMVLALATLPCALYLVMLLA